MKLIVGNSYTEVQIGGTDNLLDFNLATELDYFLSVEVPGAYFAKKKTGNHGWDGRKHYLKGAKFPTGFLPSVIRFCHTTLGLTPEVIDDRNNMPVFDSEFNPDLGFMIQRDYQEDLTKKVIKHTLQLPDGNSLYFPRGIVDAAVNAGKTCIMAGLMMHLKKPRVLITIHSKLVFDQLYKMAVDCFGSEHVGVITSKKVDFENKKCVVAESTNLGNRMQKSLDFRHKIKKSFNLLIVDEAHRAGGKVYAAVVAEIDAGAKVFFSGTALKNSSKIGNTDVWCLSGPVLGSITTNELTEKEVSRKLVIHMHDVPSTPDTTVTYKDAIVAYINDYEPRLKIVERIVKANPKNSILVAFHEKAAGSNIYNRLRKVTNCELIHGTRGNRTTAVNLFKSGHTNCLITSGILKEGVNIPNIEELIYYAGGMAPIGITQWGGRILRRSELEEGIVHDFYDKSNSHLAKHSRRRIKIYKEQGFKVLLIAEDGTVKKEL